MRQGFLLLQYVCYFCCITSSFFYRGLYDIRYVLLWKKWVLPISLKWNTISICLVPSSLYLFIKQSFSPSSWINDWIGEYHRVHTNNCNPWQIYKRNVRYGIVLTFNLILISEMMEWRSCDSATKNRNTDMSIDWTLLCKESKWSTIVWHLPLIYKSLFLHKIN